MKAIGENKKCCKCREWKLVGDFSFNLGRSDGLSPRCKTCAAKFRAENREKIKEQDKRYRDNNREAVTERKRLYRKNNPDDKEARANYARRYRARNKDAVLESKRRYYAKHKETIEERKRRYNIIKDEKFKLMEEALRQLGIEI